MSHSFYGHPYPSGSESGICPDGQLSSVKSARYVLASTEELHERIQSLTFRVHELEHGLESEHRKVGILEVQAQTQVQPHTQGTDTSPGASNSTHSTHTIAIGAGSSGDHQDRIQAVHPLLEPHLKRIARDPREPEHILAEQGVAAAAEGTVLDSLLSHTQDLDVSFFHPISYINPADFASEVRYL